MDVWEGRLPMQDPNAEHLVPLKQEIAFPSPWV